MRLKTIRLSSRQSDLARIQAYAVGRALERAHPDLKIEYRFRESLGDKNLTDPLWKAPERGLFTEDFFLELVEEKTDLVVHSWKDLPTEDRKETSVVATLPRADLRDVILVKKSALEKIRESKTLNVFSSSPRRAHNLGGFLKTHLPFKLNSVLFESVRGNVQTRVRKLFESEEADALIVAKAALDRLLSAEAPEFQETALFLRRSLEKLNWCILPLSVHPSAAAQGALAIEIKTGRTDLIEILSAIHCEKTFQQVQLERKTLKKYGGGCHQKIGISAIDRDYGRITFLKGLTDQGLVLDSIDFSPARPLSRAGSREKIWPLPGEAADFFERNTISIPDQPRAPFWVSRADAWPEAWGTSVPSWIWCSGLETWKKLSEKGIWVNGSSESLGESEDPRTDVLANEKILWTKLSHVQGFDELDPSRFSGILATYALSPRPIDPAQFNGKTHFFWKSGSSFLRALEKAPEIARGVHVSGPGNTVRIISQRLSECLGDDSKVEISLNYSDWIQFQGVTHETTLTTS